MKKLTGGACTDCGHVSWPTPRFCPQGCGQTISPVVLANEGVVYISTVVNVPHAVYGPTYQVGYVDLSGGPRVFGHFDTTELVPVGSPVSIDLVEFDTPGDANEKATTVIFRIKD